MPNREVVGLQYLRGLAAFMVVVYHLSPRLAERYSLSSFSVSVLAGGVDVFFVISGFIIWLSTTRAPKPWSWWRSRLIRVVPMYWLTLVACLCLAKTLPPLPEIVKGFLFIPAVNGHTGDFTPFFVPGWTLNYEFFFYLVMAGLLFVPRLRLIGFFVIFGTLVVLRTFADPSSAIQNRLTSPLLFEFVAGICIAVVLPHARYKRIVGVASLILAAVFLALISPKLYPNGPRTVYFGGPAALLVFGTVCLEDLLCRRVIAPLKKLGDASYSLYLSHLLVMPLPAWLLDRAGVSALIPRFLIGLATCVSAGVLIYQWIEAPLLRWMRSATGDKAKQTALPLTPARDASARDDPAAASTAADALTVRDRHALTDSHGLAEHMDLSERRFSP